jgi:aminodeoxyfutalosine synthase
VADIAAFDAAGAALPGAAGELRLVGEPAAVPDAVRAVEQLAARAGTLPVTAWSLPVLQRIAGSDAALVDLLRRLADAGLSAVAEAPVDLLEEPVRAVAAACKAGVRIARFTVHRPAQGDDVLPRLQQVKALQKATGAIRAFAPLARAQDPHAPTTGYDDVRQVALARIWLDTVETIQVDWQLYGPKLAQVALVFGADDLDAVPAVDAGERGPRRATLEEVRRNVVAASLSPVERDGRWAIRTA